MGCPVNSFAYESGETWSGARYMRITGTRGNVWDTGILSVYTGRLQGRKITVGYRKRNSQRQLRRNNQRRREQTKCAQLLKWQELVLGRSA